DYLVLGEFPQFGDAPIRTDNPETTRKMSIHEELSKIDKEADTLGVTKIPVRRFLALIGYRVPRAAFSADTSAFYLRRSKTSAEPKEKEKEQPKEDTEEPKPKKELPKREPKKQPPKKEEKKEEKKEDKEAPKDDKGE